VHVTDPGLFAALRDVDFAEVCITSEITVSDKPAAEEAFRRYSLPEVPGVEVVPQLARGRKCARSWKILPEVGSDPDYPDLTLRDAAAMREYEASRQAAE
jgi:isoleucyl-tRNA synthetase